MKPSLESLQAVIETVHKLRAPEGCPWDRAQTHQSLRPFLIEEAYEVLDVLDQVESVESLKDEKIKGAFREELGDLLMQVLLHSEMTAEQNAFDIYEVAQGLNDKLIRRHPHVFGDIKADSEESAFATWEKQKAKEKASQKDSSGSSLSSILDGVPKGLPTLQKAARVIEKVTKVGFQWSDMQGPLAKIAEELGEFQEEVVAVEKTRGTPEEPAARKRLEAELGDLLFSLCNVAFLMKVNPEDALRGNVARFESRFRHIERRLREKGLTPEQSSLEEMDRYWDEAKEIERKLERRG